MKFTVKCLCMLVACVGFSLPATAADNESGLWVIASTTAAFPDKNGPSRWSYAIDTQARYFDFGSGTNQYLIRPSVGYDIGRNATVWAGYARFRSRNAAGNTSHEDRYWQQINWSAGQWNEGALSMRVRLEQRSVSTGDDLALVLRFMTKYVRPIGTGRTNLILSIEPFVDLRDTDWGGDSGLGQNRTSVAVGWRASKRVAIEAGYMNQFIWADSGENRINHLGVVHFKFDFQ